MKKIISASILGIMLASGAALAKANVLKTQWYNKPGQTADFPISIKQAGSDLEVYAEVMVENTGNDSATPSDIEVLWNGKPVAGGEDVATTRAVFFQINDNGKLTIKNLNKDQGAGGNLSVEIH